MTRNNKILMWSLTVSIILISIYYMGWTMSPGSYERAEVYEFEIPEENLIKIIKEFKSDNSELDLSSEDKLSSGKFPILRDGKEDSSNHWYKFYFYYPDKNQIIFTWTRAK